MSTETPATALSPEADGFVPPWAEWDFNEWETCTDTDMLVVRRQNYDKEALCFPVVSPHTCVRSQAGGFFKVGGTVLAMEMEIT